MTEKHIFLGNAPPWGLVWMAGQMDGHPTPLQPLLRRVPGWHHPLSHGFWGGGCSFQMCTPASGWEFGMGVQPGHFTPWQFPCEKGTKPVKIGSWGLSACTALLQPCLPLSGNSFKIYIYIYKIKICFLYIYIYLSVLSLHGYLSPSIPTEARSPCPAPLVSSCGEAFLSVPSPRGPPKNPLGLPKTPLGPPQKPSGPSPNPSGASPTLQAPLQTLWTLCILMTVSCDVLTSLVYSDFPKPLI